MPRIDQTCIPQFNVIRFPEVLHPNRATVVGAVNYQLKVVSLV
jgi:hypothetical protein